MQENAQFEREARAVLWVQWVFFNTLGWTIGRFFVGGYEFSIEVFYAVNGAFLGVFQWFVLRHHVNMRSIQWLPIWLFTTAAGAGIGRWLAGMALSSIPAQLQIQATTNVIPRVLISGLFGLVLGFGIGLFQSAIIGRKIDKPYIWLLVNIIGWTVAFQFDAILFNSSTLGSILKALLASMVTGIGLTQAMRQNT